MKYFSKSVFHFLYCYWGNRHERMMNVFNLVKYAGIIYLLANANMGEASQMQSVSIPASVEIPTCSINAGPDTVDFGSRSRGQLQNIQGGLTPGTRTMTLNAGCTLARTMKIRIDGSARGDKFSWGGTDSILQITASHALLDGKSVQLLLINAAGVPQGKSADALSFAPGEGLVAAMHGVPVSGKQLSMVLEMVPLLGEQDSRPRQRTYPEATLHVNLVN